MRRMVLMVTAILSFAMAADAQTSAAKQKNAAPTLDNAIEIQFTGNGLARPVEKTNKQQAVLGAQTTTKLVSAKEILSVVIKNSVKVNYIGHSYAITNCNKTNSDF